MFPVPHPRRGRAALSMRWKHHGLRCHCRRAWLRVERRVHGRITCYATLTEIRTDGRRCMRHDRHHCEQLGPATLPPAVRALVRLKLGDGEWKDALLFPMPMWRDVYDVLAISVSSGMRRFVHVSGLEAALYQGPVESA